MNAAAIQSVAAQLAAQIPNDVQTKLIRHLADEVVALQALVEHQGDQLAALQAKEFQA